jgi:hypothetical protein
MFPFLYVFFGILIGFLVFADVLAFILALLGFGGKAKENQRTRGVRL